MGGHAARSARRKLDAIRNGRVPSRRGRGRLLLAKGASEAGKNGKRKSSRKAIKR